MQMQPTPRSVARSSLCSWGRLICDVGQKHCSCCTIVTKMRKAKMIHRHVLSIALVFVGWSTVYADPQGDIADLLARSKPASIVFSDGGTEWIDQTMSVSVLEDGTAVIVRSKYLTLDTDGASDEIRKCDPTSQKDTALLAPGGKPTDANAIAYFVLPWCGDAADRPKCKRNPPYSQLGLQKGDLAAVVSGENLAFAIAADVGPEKKFGEGSVELHRQLGHETVGKHPTNPTCAKNESMASEVFIVVFPKSNKKWLTPEEIDKQARKRWEDLTGPENGDRPRFLSSR